MENQDLIILNGELKGKIEDEINLLFQNKYAYEVIRLINSKPIFLELHFQRLEKTCQALGFPLMNLSLLEQEIDVLIQENQLQNTNIKIVIQNDKRVVMAIESHYPSAEQYQNGVKCLFLFEERESPEIKVFQAQLRQKSNEQIKSEEIYESVLVNHQGLITEGSRSNLFFIKNDTLHTAPDHLVLGGITRLKILEICKELSVKLVFEAIHYQDLSKFQAAFICGTSPGVLPIQSIDNFHFNVKNPLLTQLHETYHSKYLNKS